MCKHNLFEIIQLDGKHKTVMNLNIMTVQNAYGKRIEGTVNIGLLKVNIDWNDLIFIFQLKKLLDKDRNFKE